MKFCKECGAYIDERIRVNGYLICANGHQIEDEATKAIQERERLAETKKAEKRKQYLETFPDPNSDITFFRLKNPFESIDHKERAYKISEAMRELEDDYKPKEFRYFRGDALDPSRRNEEKWGIVICKTELAYDIKGAIESVRLEGGKHYTLEAIPYTLQEKSSYIQSLKDVMINHANPK